MKSQQLFILTVILFTVFSFACSSGTDPAGVNPGTQDVQGATESGNRILWGLWEVSIDTRSGSVDLVPMRGASFTANVNDLLESSPGNLMIEDLDLTYYFDEGRIDCTITLRHPLPGNDQYHGFDVWGVFMHNGSTGIGYDNLVYGDGSGDDEAVLLNPDGLTRWYNYIEFNGNGSPILEFWPGKLSDLPNPSATLNAYRVFSDGMGLEDVYYDWVTTTMNSEDRGIFKAGMINSRRYELQFPMVGGEPVVSFQYAVIASWEEGDPALTGGSMTYEPGDFPTDANSEEAFLLNVSTAASELYYQDQDNFGGDFRADIEVFDWQGGTVGGTGVPNEVESIIIEGDFLVGGSYQFSQPELAIIAVPATENSSVFQVEITNCAPIQSFESKIWVIVEAAGEHGDSYDNGYPAQYPAGARRAAFTPSSVMIDDEAPYLAVYVDNANTSGVEDGTMANPYNTIQEGIDLAPVDFQVWVDDSGILYEENVVMIDNAFVRSVNWDDSDGTNRAEINPPTIDDTVTLRFPDVDNAHIEGFKIGFAGESTTIYYADIVTILNGSGNTIQDCLFSDVTDANGVNIINAVGSTDLTIANCRIDGIQRDTDIYGASSTRCIYADNCPGIVVMNNIVTDLSGVDDNVSKSTLIGHILNTMGATVKNNLVHHVAPLTQNNGANLMSVFSFYQTDDIECVNNTIDTIDSTNGFIIQQIFCYYFDTCTSVNFTNNIVSNILCNSFPPGLGRGIMAINGTIICDYTCMWLVSTPYYMDASEGSGCISADPEYVDPDNEDYELEGTSLCQNGDPAILDWDDSGSGGSRMGSHGGPGGELIGLLTPE